MKVFGIRKGDPENKDHQIEKDIGRLLNYSHERGLLLVVDVFRDFAETHG
jgi:hypothetical protein